MKTKRNEELQSRREFFKKAAKGALPILGAAMLVSMPGIVNAVEKTPMGCKYGCAGACYGGCYGTCDTGCSSGCLTTCYRTCDGGCRGTCGYSAKY